MTSPLLVAASVSSSLAVGFVTVFLPSVRSSLQDQAQLSEERSHRLLQLQWLVLIPCLPLAGWLVDHWSMHDALFTGHVGLALAITWIALAQDFTSLIWGVIGLSASGALVLTSAITLMPHALSLSERQSIGAALSLGFVFVGLITLIVPAALPWLIRQFGHRPTILTVGLLCLIPALLSALIAKPEFPQTRPSLPLRESWEDPRLWLIALATFLYFPLERLLEIWPRPYLAEIGYSSRAVTRLLVGFWCSFLVMRFALSWLMGPGYEAWLLIVLLVVSSMILGNLIGAYAPSSGYVGFWLIGACYGPLLPVFLGIFLELEGLRGVPGLALGALLSLSALNSLLVQPAFGAYAKTHSTRACMRIPMILGLVAAAPTLVLAIIRHGR